MNRLSRLFFTFLLVMAVSTVSAESTSLKSDSDKLAYSVGVNIAFDLKNAGVKSLDTDLIAEAMRAYYADEPLLLERDEAAQFLADQLTMIAEKTHAEAKARGAAWLADMAMVEGVKETPTGLLYKVVKESDGGAVPSVKDKVRVQYEGWMIDGTKFDSTFDRGHPHDLPLQHVIAGWQEGLQMMAVGSIYEFYIPEHLGYGQRGWPGSVGPYEALKFRIELLDVNPVEPIEVTRKFEIPITVAE